MYLPNKLRSTITDPSPPPHNSDPAKFLVPQNFRDGARFIGELGGMRFTTEARVHKGPLRKLKSKTRINLSTRNLHRLKRWPQRVTRRGEASA